MSRRIPPHDLDAERSVIGAALVRQQVVENLKGTLDPSDFYSSKYQHVWQAMLDMHEVGEPIDVVTVAAHVNPLGVEADVLSTAMAEVPAVSAHERYAAIVVECSRRRRLLAHFSELAQRCYEEPADDVLADSDPGGDHLIARRDDAVRGLYSLDEFMVAAQTRTEQEPWLVPHIFRPRWRAVVVAGEGVGKAVLMRTIGLLASAGRDPWMPDRRIEPIRSLYVDAENAQTTIYHQVRIAHLDHDIAAEAADNYFIWHREGGINLRDRRMRAEFERVLQATRPDIVFAGPFYKLFRRKGSEDLEQSTIEFLEVIDDFRVRFNFAVMLEAHAPKGVGGGHREMNPRGSAALMGWPEFGLTLEVVGNPLPTEQALTLDIGRFRRDREPADWPTQIRRGQMNQRTAWDARWENGRNRMGFPF